jgi:hypothetical protein
LMSLHCATTKAVLKISAPCPTEYIQIIFASWPKQGVMVPLCYLFWMDSRQMQFSRQWGEFQVRF